MKTFGFSILGGVLGYAIGLFAGIGLILGLSSNTHDKSMEAVMTGFFATGPFMALAGFVATFIYLRFRRNP